VSAEQIVRDIAAEEDPCDSNIEEWCCAYCGSWVGDLLGDAAFKYGRTNDPSAHPETCVWRRSKEWVAASGEST
jgi:hypothetical protein